MPSDYEIFDAARHKLTRGINIVEASAGTGKTYAIGMLVLRALVELRVPIDKILIVTFTKAATEELKARIRSRLVEARELFRVEAELNEREVDKTLFDWILTIKDRKSALNRLQLALYDIDQAGIFTIHGFCQRMLVEQALESGQLFDVELLADINHVRNEVADDFWRTRIYSLAPLPCSLLSGCFATPEKLLASITAALSESGQVEPRVGSVDDVLLQLNKTMENLRSWWSEHSTNLYHCFSASLPEGSFKKPFSEGFEDWFQSLSSFFSGKNIAVPDNLHLLSRDSLTGELNGSRIRGDAKKLAYLANWPLPDNEIEPLLASINDLILTFRVKLAEELPVEVSRRLEQQGTIGFNDLILSLSKALKGDRGSYLKQVIGDRFSVALIDEFQDTDSSQWHIFSTLFGGTGHYLYLIGDPKQAIYKFRGADIHSYFLAREAASQLLTLERNYRSHPFLVDEVNRLFSSRTNPFFFDEKTLDYRPVKAAKIEEDADLVKGSESLAGMVYCSLPTEPNDKNGRWTSGKAASEFRRFIVSEIGRLLAPEDPVLLKNSDQLPPMRSLAPHDIAILVRSNRQAEEYRQALSETSIPAVIGSRQSVFETNECREMLLLLQAIALPVDTGRLKTAMTIRWFGFSGNRLHKLWQDEERLSQLHSRFLQYNQRWQEQGFLTMMNGLLVAEDVLPTLASGRMAERIIANIYHLLELVQEQEIAENLGIGQILQWLRKMMRGELRAENGELFLESDKDAVRIVTMHSAKGLEYPVVFCPYLWYSSDRIKGEKYQIRCHDEAHQIVIDLGSNLFGVRKDQAAQEEMAEDLRLLYVALTRAKIRCYVSWADVKKSGSVGDSFNSALGYLLFKDGKLDCQGQQVKFAELAHEKSAQHVALILGEPTANYQRIIEEVELTPMASSARSLHTDWQMSSFSAMASLSEYDHEYDVVTLTDAGESKAGSKSTTTVPVTGLPAGPNFGNVIHDLLESLSFSAIAMQEQDEILVDLLRQKCLRYGVDAVAGDVKKLLEMVVTTSLAKGSYCLSMLSDNVCLKEMGFYFHLSRLVTDQINTILADEPTVTRLGYKVMRGYLTGFVDLICEYGGKYYILDYKTNFLGESMADYGPEKLIAAMQSHNYGLQYWIYTLVLHRHLQNLMPDYCYEQHFGGVMYLFVRGMSPDIPGSGVFSTLPDYGKLLALDLAIGGAEGE
ncbi:MAG: exodeoxyribonuclease V subunit beta [Desulfobulbaceae bacterium]|nr:exodeoxyribonuclease V subunit beta [Desulfobulbaceae bacterium]